MEDDDQWIKDFITVATRKELHTLLEFVELNNYDDELIKQLKLKIEKAP